jgi:D-beta-D-heptose 7-phosphate kinase / D-beta-D-heptose 1-phosphate adenosyltransferase
MKFESLFRILNGFHAARVLVLGDVMLDRFVYGSVERISPEAPIPVVNVERVMDMPGGAANVARNIAAMGARVILLGAVGEDVWAQDLRTQLKLSPTIDAQLIGDSSRPTTVKTRYVADGQQVMRADRESRLALPAAVEQAMLDRYSVALRDVSVVVLSDYAKGVLSDSVARAAIDIARKTGKTIIVDPKAKDFAKYRGATILTPNRLELQQACGQECVTDEQVVNGARGIVDQKICDAMIVTRGKYGMSVIQSDGLSAHLPTAARQVFDVSGAGDTAVAAISLSIAADAGVDEAAALANIAAGIVVGKRGTATVNTGEIIAALNPFDGRTDPQKIFALDSVLQLARSWREQGLKIAFANGCFDLVHPGHVSLLEQARRSADRLIVGLNADPSIRRLKGPNRPVQSEVARATVLASMKSVDAVVIFAEDTPINLIETLEPDVLVKGADYTLDKVVGADFVIRRGGKVVLAELLTGHSTTDTVKRVAGSSAS